MRIMIELIVLAGAVQLAIAIANFFLPRVLRPAAELARVSPMIREMFFIHWIYIVCVLLVFASLSFLFAPVLASGQPLGRFLSATIALFWLARVPIQFFYYDAALRRTNRLADVTCLVAFIFLGVVYGIAAAGVWS